MKFPVDSGTQFRDPQMSDRRTGNAIISAAVAIMMACLVKC